MSNKWKTRLSIWGKRVLTISFWLLVWQFGSLLIQNSIVLVGPLDVAKTLLMQLWNCESWLAIVSSLGKISLGFLTAFLLGLALGAAAFNVSCLKSLLEPPVVVMKSIPVASFVILALILVGSENLSVFIAFTIVFPSIYIGTVAGLESTDPKLLEMAKVFHLSAGKRIYYIYRNALMPYLISNCKVSLGMSWKAGIAAEVIGIPQGSIGEQLYMSKIYLSTTDLFAWTAVIILVSVLLEKFFIFILRLFQPNRKKLSGERKDGNQKFDETI